MTRPEPPGKPRYHHGDLRAALLRSAEEELGEVGVERFSLRSVAKRAGVSHAAPAHHFGDTQGLMTALCAEGFRRFLAAQRAREALAAPDARSQIVAAGLGYVDFALANPALFRLMFSSSKPDRRGAELVSVGGEAFAHLVEQVKAVGGEIADGNTLTTDVAGIWAAAHGLADLMASRPFQPVAAWAPEQRDAFLSAVIERSLPDRGS